MSKRVAYSPKRTQATLSSVPDAGPLATIVILGALNGLELFGHERENIEVFEILRRLGARVAIGVNQITENNQVARELTDRGFETFVLPFGNQWSWQWLKRYPLSIGEKVSQVWRCSKIFRRKIAQLKPDYIYLTSPLVYSFLSLALWRGRVPLIYRAVDLPPIDSPFNMIFWRSAMRRARVVVGISAFTTKAVEQAAARTVKGKTFLIYGTPSHRSSESEVQEKQVVYVGQVSENKGVKRLVQAFAEIAASYSGWVLDIVGGSRFSVAGFESEIKGEVKQLGLEDRIFFHGYQKDPLPWVRRAALQVVPSLTEEPLGIVVLEAKAMSVPVLVSPRGGLPEMVRHKVDGYICSDTSVPALTEGLRWMLDRSDELKRMGFAAKQDFDSRFSLSRLSARWLELFQKLELAA